MRLSSNKEEEKTASTMVDKQLADRGLTRNDWPMRCRKRFEYMNHYSYGAIQSTGKPVAKKRKTPVASGKPTRQKRG